MKRLFAAVLLGITVSPIATLAQQHTPDWPRHPKSGRVEWVGTLPWPAAATTPNQQRALAKGWYMAHLTDEPAARARAVEGLDTTYAGVLTEAYLDSVWYSPIRNPDREKVTYRLIYQVELVAGPLGLSYRLYDFVWVAIGEDYSNSMSLENILPKSAVLMRSYEQRLRQALAGW